jgi:long-chain acyl-CoA synthetase
VAELPARFAATRGDEVAIVDDVGEITWYDFNLRTNRCLNAIRARGHEPGETIAVLCGNRREFLETTTALSHGGYLFPPINWHFTPDEVAHVLADSHATAVLVDDAHVELGLDAVGRLDRSIDVIVIGGDVPPGTASYETILAAASDAEPPDQALGTVMMYTSGTTGRPKGVRSTGISLGTPMEVGRLAIEGYVGIFGIDPAGRTLINSPLYHGGPYVFGAVPFGAGCAIVLRRRFEPATTLKDIDRFGITNAYFVPTHFARMLRLPAEHKAAFDGSSLRTVWHTAAPCPPEVKRAMIEWWGPVIHETYAATDAGIGTLISSEEWLAHPGSVGRASPLSDVLIIGDDGQELPPGRTGTIYLRNRLGGDVRYHNDDAKTAAAHLAPGVVTVGDVGHLDEDGYLYLSDRKIDMIISGGVNIYPAEIEARLMEHPAVLDVAVFGVPDEEFGEQVKAAVLLADGYSPSPELERELAAFCREQLAGYKTPRSFDFPAEFPRTPTGKLVKRLLRDAYWEGLERTI